MKFSLKITLTEEDYLSFNNFQAIESKQAQKTIKKTLSIFIIWMVALMVLLVVFNGWDAFSTSYVTMLGIFTVAYSLCFKKLIHRNIKARVKHQKKCGKLPYDSLSTLEFYEDKIVEITPSKRIEQSYDVLERICLLPGRYILLYTSSVSAYILPVYQVNAQANKEEFWDFISQKCKNIEKY